MLNTIILMGRLTADPELRTTPNGLSVASCTLAVDRKFQKQGEKQADFIPVIAWRNQAEFLAKYFFKGDMIAVEGTLQSRRYEDKNGNPRTAYDVIAERLSFCGGKTEREPAAPSAAPAPAPAKTAEPVQEKMDLNAMSFPVDDDGLPF